MNKASGGEHERNGGGGIIMNKLKQKRGSGLGGGSISASLQYKMRSITKVWRADTERSQDRWSTG